MNSFYSSFKKAVIISFLLIVCLQGKSQLPRSIYFMDHVPQAVKLNPAFQPEFKYYISLPYISSLYLGFESPFSFNELTSPRADDSLFIDRDQLIGALKEKNYFAFDITDELIHGGFSFKSNHFHFGISRIFTARFSFPREFAKLFFYGNGHPDFLGRTSDMGGIGLNVNSYHQFSMGYSHTFMDKLSLGATVKYLNGAFNIWTKKSDFSFYNDPESNYAFTISSDVEIKTSTSLTSFDNLIDQVEKYKWFDLSDNNGWAFDFGAVYEINEKFSTSVSVIDIGKITWRENLKTYRSDNPGDEFSFNGFDINDFFHGKSWNDSLDILDTLREHFNLTVYNEKYSSHLNPRIYTAGTFNLNKTSQLGLLVKTDIAEKVLKPSFTVQYLYQLPKFVSLYANYSILERKYFNIGFGGTFQAGPVQIFIFNDNFRAFFRPNDQRHYNVMLGINLLFGKIKKDVSPEPEIKKDLKYNDSGG